jgi:hypothetical protein
MASNKTEFLNMRVSPATKQALLLIAQQENRSMANTIEWLVAEYQARSENVIEQKKRPRIHAG